MALDSLLVELLVCPEDKGPLWYLESEEVLFNPRLARTYPVREGIPVLLIGEATTLSAEDAARLRAAAEDRGVRTGPVPEDGTADSR
jgi:uncharacterized protein YbaR (Trm112 family)